MARLQIISVAAASTMTGLAAQADWRQLTPATMPGPLARAAMAHDFLRGESVLFGGSNGLIAVDDTWVWDGSTWQQASPAMRPSPRLGHAMVYEARQSRVLLFGGTPGFGGNFDDTWVWDGAGWTELLPANRPPARSAAGAAYDLVRGRAVIYGGGDVGQFLNDTWEWDGTDWTQRAPATQPPYLSWPAMSFDVDRGVSVLVGGWDSFQSISNQTWEWDGSDWRLRQSNNVPPARAGASLDYDRVRGVHVLFGGQEFPPLARLGDTWEWNGTDWTARNPAMPITARAYHQTVFHATAGRLLLFGGDLVSGSSQETFEYYTADVAAISPYGSACSTSLGPLTLSSVAGPPWIGDAIGARLANLPAGCLPFLAIGLQRVQVDLGPVGIPGCWQYVDPIGTVVLAIAGTSASWNWQVPNDPAVAGVTFRLQGGALLAGGSNAFGAATSNGLEAVIGVR